MIGGLAKVVQDVPPFVIADGQPARIIGLNSVGLSRAGIPENVRRELKKVSAFYIGPVSTWDRLLRKWSRNLTAVKL